MTDTPHAEIIESVDDIIRATASEGTALQRVCDYIRGAVPGCDWVGFYVVIPGSRELALGPYSGESTDHLRIPFGRGVRGQAAEAETTIVVDDVSAEANYLSCSPKVRSEVVIPLFHDGAVVGEFDIDSHEPAAFDTDRRRLLESLAERFGKAVVSLMPPAAD